LLLGFDELSSWDKTLPVACGMVQIVGCKLYVITLQPDQGISLAAVIF